VSIIIDMRPGDLPTTINFCPERGAPSVDGTDCWQQLGALLAWEAHDAELAAEHFLTVACYNLQHPARFTDEALAGLRAALIDRLDRRVPVAVLRRRAAVVYNGNKPVLRPHSERRIALRRWRLTNRRCLPARAP
jgi:hypothetical protein